MEQDTGKQDKLARRMLRQRDESTGNGSLMTRTLMCVLGVLTSGISVGLFSLSQLGMDPFQVLAHGIWRHTPVSFGTCYVIICAVMFLAVLLMDRRKIGLGTMINLFLFGYIADFSEKVFAALIPSRAFPVRLAELIAALVIMCFGSAMYFTADLGVSVYDALALTADERTNIPFAALRIGGDLICVLAGGLLCYLSDYSLAPGGALLVTAGVGTVITAFFMGPLIAFFRRTVSEPLRYGCARP